MHTKQDLDSLTERRSKSEVMYILSPTYTYWVLNTMFYFLKFSRTGGHELFYFSLTFFYWESNFEIYKKTKSKCRCSMEFVIIGFDLCFVFFVFVFIFWKTELQWCSTVSRYSINGRNQKPTVICHPHYILCWNDSLFIFIFNSCPSKTIISYIIVSNHSLDGS